MKSGVFAFAVIGCCSAFAQAPPQVDAQRAAPVAQGGARDLTIRGVASSEPNTAERQVGGLEAVTSGEARPRTAVMGFSAGAGAGVPTERATVAPWIDRNSSANGGPN